MAGPYTKGKSIQDNIWMQFLDDVAHGELDGISKNDFSSIESISIDFPIIKQIPEIEKKQIRQYIAELLKGFRESEGQQSEQIINLIKFHGEYCKSTGSNKWKRVHNVIAYRYANSTPLTIRMIGRMIGSGKEEVDHDIREGLMNMVTLLCGYSSICVEGADIYDTVEAIMRDYKILNTSAKVDINNLLPIEYLDKVAEYRRISNHLIEAFDKSVELYSIFCDGYGGQEKRRLSVLNQRFLQGSESVPDMAKKTNTGISTIQNDTRINIKRISEVMFR